MIFKKNFESIYKSHFFTRYDDSGNVFYYSAKDFESLKCTPHPFTASAGHILKGYFYYYESYIPGRIIVFDHGFGGGHRAYMKEIEKLCRHGFYVFAYDHTGCMESEGESTNGLAQSLCDLNDCLLALKNDIEYAGWDISVMGHSWGAYSCLNITALHPDISHIVAISGYISVKNMINQLFGGFLSIYRKRIYGIEKQNNPIFFCFDAKKALSETNAKVLLIYSDDDKIVQKKYHYDVLKRKLKGIKNIRFILVSGKGHNPNYTEDAVQYMGEFFNTLTYKVKNNMLNTQIQKSEFLSSFDWERMTAQDEKIWNEIFRALEA